MNFLIDNWKSESRHQDYISYVKESYIKEAIEMLKESGNKVSSFPTNIVGPHV